MSQQAPLKLEGIPQIILLIDAIALISAALLAQTTVYGPGFYVLETEGIVAGITGAAILGLLAYQRNYRIQTFVTPLRSLSTPLLTVLLSSSFSYFFFKDIVEGSALFEPWLRSFSLLCLSFFIVGRLFFMLFAYVVQRRGWVERRIAILGASVQTDKLIELGATKDTGINKIIGLFDDRKERIGPEYGGMPVLGTTADLIEFARQDRLDEVIVALPWSAEDRLNQLTRQLVELPVRVRIVSDVVGFNYLGRSVTDELFTGLPMLNVANKPLAGWQSLLKFLEDKILTLFILILISPIMIATAIAVKLDSKGPIFFRQKRFGFNNQQFDVYKFRSMYTGNEAEAGKRQATRDDPRITRVGRFIRKTSIDELPQLLNVLEGTMSLVGPRPHSVDHNIQYSQDIQGYYARHKVKPGITGWAQVNGLRGETDTLEKMEYRVLYDVYYIENWSLLLDFEILILTAFVGIVGKNAY